ncbi:MAG: hypothetical protein GWP05_05370 [Anaerolineaceae bacterium]|nr:hypothetical protein [Anaerolineaceae bacterium]
MAEQDLDDEAKLRKLLESNPRYPREAYEFISESIAYTSHTLDREGHVTGGELCQGARRLALEQFGFLARTVLESWNIRETADFGRLVYGMIEADLLKKTESDSIDDFSEVYDFQEAFDRDFCIETETNQ